MNNKKLNREDFIKMANKIYIKPSNDVLLLIEKEYDDLEKELINLKKINVENVLPLTRISKPISYLREDEIDQSIYLDKNSALSNSADKDQDNVIMKRILK